ncbi:TraR/DksA C4-type zinc finger protein [Halomonas elongata]|nr:TraR/DksA C4-type zinc finger protein [Halomonas elongata]WPU46504.1 TraR/DksA C4-type zinc finger protein [Halomonas elongata DSM 2581]
MADNADVANELMDRRLEQTMQACRLPEPTAESAECEECGDPIPEARRQAAPWARTCIDCQALLEQLAKRRA